MKDSDLEKVKRYKVSFRGKDSENIEAKSHEEAYEKFINRCSEIEEVAVRVIDTSCENSSQGLRIFATPHKDDSIENKSFGQTAGSKIPNGERMKNSQSPKPFNGWIHSFLTIIIAIAFSFGALVWADSQATVGSFINNNENFVLFVIFVITSIWLIFRIYQFKEHLSIHRTFEKKSKEIQYQKNEEQARRQEESNAKQIPQIISKLKSDGFKNLEETERTLLLSVVQKATEHPESIKANEMELVEVAMKDKATYNFLTLVQSKTSQSGGSGGQSNLNPLAQAGALLAGQKMAENMFEEEEG